MSCAVRFFAQEEIAVALHGGDIAENNRGRIRLDWKKRNYLKVKR
jgi:hypothetical protein